VSKTPKNIDRLYGLEPVFEPGEGPGSDALERFVDIECPYCAERITMRIDLSAGPQTYVEDCQVCCQPITVSVPVAEEGELLEVTAERLGQ
jgi:Cysteine-rich CPXCG